MRTLLLLALAPVWAAELRIGRAVVNITPPVGAPMGSSYGITISTGIHDDLFAKTLVLDVDGVRAAMLKNCAGVGLSSRQATPGTTLPRIRAALSQLQRSCATSGVWE